MTLSSQRGRERVEDLRFVVDDENYARCHVAVSVTDAGKAIRTVVPSDRLLVTVMLPPRPSMIFRVIARPTPVPVRRVVKNGSKIRGRSSALMPTPRSAMSIRDRKSTRLNSSHGYISYAV